MKLATYVRKLKDYSGNYIVPATRSTGVYLNDNQTLQSWIDIMEEDKFDLLTVYPVGSIYQSTGDSSPASLFGGDWERLYDRFLVGAGGTYGVGNTGGEASHILTNPELPVTEGQFMMSTFITVRNSSDPIVESASGICSLINSTYISQNVAGYVPEVTRPRGVKIKFGGSQPHNNMPPYYAVNIWRRTA